MLYKLIYSTVHKFRDRATGRGTGMIKEMTAEWILKRSIYRGCRYGRVKSIFYSFTALCISLETGKLANRQRR